MLKIKDGKLYGSNYAFALPEGFYLNVGSAIKFGCKRLELAADDGFLIIIIYFKNVRDSAKDIQEIIDADNNLMKMGDFVSVKRRKGEGRGLYYKDELRSVEHYEEWYDFKENVYGETQLNININLWSDRRKQTIQEALCLPTVKAFLESIEYF